VSDNITLDVWAGGDTSAADDIGGVKHQRCKATIGVDGTNDGDVALTNPMPTLASDVPFAGYGQTIVGTTAVQLPSCPANRGVVVRAFSDNAENIYIDHDSNVGSGGLVLFPGESMCLYVSNSNLIWAKAYIANQILIWSVI
jgi:hypothetical protein